MHVPRNPPDTEHLLKDDRYSAIILSEEVGRYARDFNGRYLHWSEVRRRDTGSIDPDIVWARMKLAREDNCARVPLDDIVFSYVITENLLEKISEFDMKIGYGVFSESEGFLEKGCYSADSLMEESIASSQAEGAVTTAGKAREMLRRNPRPKDGSETMILNNYRAMQFIKKHVGDALTPEFIKHVHKLVTDGTMDKGYVGRFRNNDSVVVQDPVSGEVFHRPVPADRIEAYIAQLCDFVNRMDMVHPLIKGMILHYALAYIHPFEDGNGRVARSLFYWYELDHGYPEMEYLSLSRYIRDHKGRYGEAYVFGETDDNDMTYFFLYNLEALIDSAEEFQEYLSKRIREERSVRTRISGLNDRQVSEMTDVLNGGAVTVRSILAEYGVSLNTARADIRVLLERGLLRESGRETNAKVYTWSGKDL